MARRFLVVAAGILVVGCMVSPVFAGEQQVGASPPVTGDSGGASGELAGAVTVSNGAPVEDVLLSLSGPGGSSLAVSDAAGRFRFAGLPAGRYLLRAHLARAGDRRRFVDIEPGETVFEPLVLNAPGESNQQLLLAGSALPSGGLPSMQTADEAGRQQAAGDAPSDVVSMPDEPGDQSTTEVSEQPQDAKMWWLRRARRSVLKERMAGVSLVQRGRAVPETGNAGSARERWRAAEYGSLDHPLTGIAGLPISGQVHLLTRATLAGQGFLWPSETWPGQVAYVSVAPADAGDWALRGTVDMTTGETSSWAIAGWYSVEPRKDHDVEMAVSYSRQAHAAAADLRLDGGGTVDTGVPRREVGRIQASDSWTVSSALEVGYGAELARYGYLEDSRLFSPQADVTVTPVAGTRMRAAASRNMIAPGGEQFLPPLDGAWLPPERTYTSLSGLESLRAERVRHLEVGVEHEIGERSVLGVRRFSQEVDDQLMAMFSPGVYTPLETLPASGGHYYLAGAGGVDVDGWGVTFDHEIEERLRSTVDYRIVRSEWAASASADRAGLAADRLRNGMHHFQDVSATLQAEIPETSTRVVARCRVSTAFARLTPGGMRAGLDTRFDVQVTQTLPFAPLEGSSWELLVALRSLFHEPNSGASIYDELLVVDPPRQLVGGLVVHF
jgi:hypothetical protein